MKNLIRRIIPDFLISWYHFLLAFSGALIYNFPSKKVKVIGVTGTNGKSTVVYLISRILEEAGYATASLSSIEFKIKERIWQNDLKMTMPGRTKIQEFLSQAKKAGCQYAVLEVTSEGIKQHRHKFIDFNTAVFTNLTKEHLESHKGFDNYKKAKGKLFKSIKKRKIIVNSDDPNSDYFLNFQAKEKISYSLNKEADVFGFNLKLKNTGISFKVKEEEFSLNLLGKFNGYNSLAAIAVGLSEEIDLKTIKSALEKIKTIPGRLEIVVKKPFLIIVDYAHTPDALEKVYQAIKPISRKLIGVLGSAGGGRDKWKRPEMGQIAEKYLDYIILTNEDPYYEDPKDIINQIKKGIKQKKSKVLIDRRKAIKKALLLAQEGDSIIITGKGCEPWMCVKDKKIPWDDRRVVKEEMEKNNA